MAVRGIGRMSKKSEVWKNDEKSGNSHGKVMEKSGKFEIENKWQPCCIIWCAY